MITYQYAREFLLYTAFVLLLTLFQIRIEEDTYYKVFHKYKIEAVFWK